MKPARERSVREELRKHAKFGESDLLRSKHIETLEVLRGYSKESERLEEENKALREQLRSLGPARFGAAEALSELQAENQSLKARMQILETQIGQMEDDHRRKTNTLITNHAQALAASRNRTDELDQLRTARDRDQQEIVELKLTVQRLMMSESSLNRELSSLREAHAISEKTWQTRLKDIESELRQKHTRIELLLLEQQKAAAAAVSSRSSSSREKPITDAAIPPPIPRPQSATPRKPRLSSSSSSQLDTASSSSSSSSSSSNNVKKLKQDLLCERKFSAKIRVQWESADKERVMLAKELKECRRQLDEALSEKLAAATTAEQRIAEAANEVAVLKQKLEIEKKARSQASDPDQAKRVLFPEYVHLKRDNERLIQHVNALQKELRTAAGAMGR